MSAVLGEVEVASLVEDEGDLLVGEVGTVLEEVAFEVDEGVGVDVFDIVVEDILEFSCVDTLVGVVCDKF